MSSMDTFDGKILELGNRIGPELTIAISPMKKVCICPRCPTHTVCAKNAQENLFCVMGRSFHCITENSGCLCPVCPLFPQLGLNADAYCLRGAESSVRYVKGIRQRQA
jgi:Protein of unknown function (DUF2769)